jgi:hypothetical protein
MDELQEKVMSEPIQMFKLRRAGDRILYYAGDGEEGIPVRVSWARPLTDRGGEVAILHATKKQEITTLGDFKHLDSDSQEIVAEELERRYFLPKITKVMRTTATFGNRYWDVETDCGEREFLVKSPETDVTWITEDRCVLKDALGNCYEIESLEALDRTSRANADKVL